MLPCPRLTPPLSPQFSRARRGTSVLPRILCMRTYVLFLVMNYAFGDGMEWREREGANFGLQGENFLLRQSESKSCCRRYRAWREAARGRDSHKRRPKVRCHFFGMQLREEGAKGFEKWGLCSIYLCCQFHRGERTPSQIFQEKAKLSLNCTLQRSGKHWGPLEKKNLGHTWYVVLRCRDSPFLYCVKFKYSKSAGQASSSPLTPLLKLLSRLT